MLDSLSKLFSDTVEPCTCSRCTAQGRRGLGYDNEPSKLTMKERLEKQRRQNYEDNERAWEMVQAREAKAQVPANNMYWPPYNHMAQDGEKHIKIEYIAPVSIAVMSLEEAKEFYVNMGGKSTISDTRNVKNLTLDLANAYDIAMGLGGLGVKAQTKVINGSEWVIISDFRRHLKTLEKGHKWGANNPRIVQLGLGLNDARGATRYVKSYVKINAGIEIAFAVGVNVADYILRDEATLTELGVNMAGDLAKSFVALAGAAVFTAVFVPATAGVLITGVVYAFVTFGIGYAVEQLDQHTGFSKSFQETIENYLK